MAELTADSPVFILGSLRSGASLLSLSLGQHSALHPVLDNRWLEELIAGLLRGFNQAAESKATSQLEIDGVELDTLFEHFGDSARDLMRRSVPTGKQLIDATPANIFLAVPLQMLFPEARFIHVVRDGGEVVAKLTDPGLSTVYKSRQILCTPEQAADHWASAVTAGFAAERALGASTVLRINRNCLISQPEETLTAVLDFLGLPFEAATLRPFSSVSPESVRAGEFALDRFPAALELNDRVAEPIASVSGDESERERLFAELWQRAMRGQPLVPPIPGTKAAARLGRKRAIKRRSPETPVPESALMRFMQLLGQRRGAPKRSPR
jgi:hypothetical protein